MDIKYITFNLSEIDKINFNELMTTSIETMRFSNNNLGLIKFTGEIPPSVQSLETKSQEYTNSEILVLLEGEEWIIYIEPISGTTDNLNTQ
jgi:hypothetical protein